MVRSGTQQTWRTTSSSAVAVPVRANDLRARRRHTSDTISSISGHVLHSSEALYLMFAAPAAADRDPASMLFDEPKM